MNVIQDNSFRKGVLFFLECVSDSVNYLSDNFIIIGHSLIPVSKGEIYVFAGLPNIMHLIPKKNLQAAWMLDHP